MSKRKTTTQIVLHTAAFRGRADAAIIRKWHLEKGYSDIAYHYVITGSSWDATSSLEKGRSEELCGAHAFGSNYNSIGICLTGHGDYEHWSDRQLGILFDIVPKLMLKYRIPSTNVIGHRETPWEKLKRFKTCPGKLIDMKEIRKHIINQI
jgi:N-acetyl-anhydromuramyl-L-alanine amidase AmpD